MAAEQNGEPEVEASGDEDDSRDAVLHAMPVAERARIGDVVFAKSGKYPPWPAFVYHPGDVQEELRRKCYKKAKEGAKTHHIVFYYNYGANGFDAVPFKNVLPWTEETLETAKKGYKKDQKLGPAIQVALDDIDRPKKQRAPGPPDKKKKVPDGKLGKAPKRGRTSRGDGDDSEDDEDGEAVSGDDEGSGGSEYGGKRGKKSSGGKRRDGHEPRSGSMKERAKAKVDAFWTTYQDRFPALRGDHGTGDKGSGRGEGRKRKRSVASESSAPKKLKKDFKSETSEERFRRLTRNLKILLEDKVQPNVVKICTTLEKLAGVSVTLATLTETGAGQIVKDLRKHSDQEIQAKAKLAFTRWKEAFREEVRKEDRHEDGQAGERKQNGGVEGAIEAAQAAGKASEDTEVPASGDAP